MKLSDKMKMKTKAKKEKKTEIVISLMVEKLQGTYIV